MSGKYLFDFFSEKVLKSPFFSRIKVTAYENQKEVLTNSPSSLNPTEEVVEPLDPSEEEAEGSMTLTLLSGFRLFWGAVSLNFFRLQRANSSPIFWPSGIFNSSVSPAPANKVAGKEQTLLTSCTQGMNRPFCYKVVWTPDPAWMKFLACNPSSDA